MAAAALSPSRIDRLRATFAAFEADAAPFYTVSPLRATAEQAEPQDLAEKAAAAGWALGSAPCAGVAMHSRSQPGTSLRKYRAAGVIHAPPSVVSHLLWDTPTRLTWDTSSVPNGLIDLVKFGGAPGVCDEAVVQHMLIHAVLVVSQRDFVCLHARLGTPSGGVIAVSSEAVEDGGLCPVDPAFVRGSVMEGSGWYCEPTSGPAGEAWTRLLCEDPRAAQLSVPFADDSRPPPPTPQTC
jgi:hypothetical protein